MLAISLEVNWSGWTGPESATTCEDFFPCANRDNVRNNKKHRRLRSWYTCESNGGLFFYGRPPFLPKNSPQKGLPFVMGKDIRLEKEMGETVLSSFHFRKIGRDHLYIASPFYRSNSNRTDFHFFAFSEHCGCNTRYFSSELNALQFRQASINLRPS